MKKFLFLILAFFSSVSIAHGGALLNALKSKQTEMLAGAHGVYIIFVQSRDGESTASNVEALDTLYLLSDQSKFDMEIFRTIVFETDKNIRLLRYRLVDDIWGETVIYNPADLPNLDFQKAYRLVKEYSGKDQAIASIGIFYALVPGEPLIVSFQMKGDEDEFCKQYQYYFDTDQVFQTAQESKCFFDMDE